MEHVVNGISATANGRRSIFAASMISAVGAAIFMILPLVIGAAAESQELTSDKAGLVASSYFFAYLLICLSAVFWINRIPWRVVSLCGFILLTCGLLVTVLFPYYGALLAGMFVSGCGAGILFGLALCVISETDDPDRYFGVKIVAEQLLGAALLFALPLIMRGNDDFETLIWVTALVLASLTVVTFWLPERGTKCTAPEEVTGRTGLSWPLWLGLAALLVYFGGLAGVWSFVERIADSNGIDMVTIGRGLSFGVIGGGVGAFVAAVTGDRFGRIKPLVAAGLVIAMVLWAYSREFSGLTFAVLTFLFSGMWNYALAYQLGIVASADFSGRYVVLMSAALGSGAMLGPALAGFLIQGTNFAGVFIMALAAVVLATTAFVVLVRQR